jgi:hypothetical protein
MELMAPAAGSPSLPTVTSTPGKTYKEKISVSLIKY